MPEKPTPKPLEAVKIDERSYRIEDNGVRALLFIGTERALLIDAGFGAAGSLKALVTSLTDKPVILALTHADGDHIGCAHEFESAYMHPSEMSYYMAGEHPKIPVFPLWEGDVIDIGGACFEVILIPGHTPGSIAFLYREKRLLISGDSILSGPVYIFGEVRNLNAYKASVIKLISRRGEFDSVYPAHGPTFPLEASILDKSLAAAEKVLAGEVEGVAPPYPMPAKMFLYNGVGFYCDK